MKCQKWDNQETSYYLNSPLKILFGYDTPSLVYKDEPGSIAKQTHIQGHQ